MLTLVIAAIPLYIIYVFFGGVYQFLVKPNLLARSLEMLQAMLLCFGAWILFIWLILMMPPPRCPWQEEDDFYQDTSKWYEKLWMSPIILLVMLWISIAPIFMAIIAFYDEFIAPWLEQWASQFRDGRSE